MGLVLESRVWGLRTRNDEVLGTLNCVQGFEG